MKTNSLILAGVAGIALASPLLADVTLVVTGGNASRAVQYDRAAFILSGETVVNPTPANSNLRSFVNGTIPGQPGLGNVTIHFVLNGADKGLADLKNQAPVVTATGASLVPQVAVSGTYPETVGINGSVFNSSRTLVIPFGYVKNTALPNSLGGVTNLSQRQAAYLQAASGTLPTAFFGGSSDTDPLLVIGRNTGAAVRQIIDANIYFSGTPTFYTTNSAGAPIVHPLGGHDGGGKVVADLLVIPNAIGTLASADFGAFTPLAFEGYLPTPLNVIKGNYPIWGYESWYTKNSNPGAPSANQQAVIDALYAAVTDTTYQHTPGNAFSNALFVPIADLEVERSSDGGPITSILY